MSIRIYGGVWNVTFSSTYTFHMCVINIHILSYFHSNIWDNCDNLYSVHNWLSSIWLTPEFINSAHKMSATKISTWGG